MKRINVENDTAAAIHRGIQWYAENIENTGDGEPLVVRDENTPNSVVNQSLWRREMAHATYLEQNGETDPHANLPTDSLSFENHRKVMEWVLANT